jgi:surfeit locus 1 family protein
MTAAAASGRRSAAAATFIAITILVSLGTWQVHRLRWKQALLADIDRAELNKPVPLAGVPSRFTKVSVAGTWRPGTALFGVEVRPGAGGVAGMGAQRLQILDRAGAAPLLVDQGFVTTEGTPPPPASGPATVVGYVRAPEQPNWLSAEDDVAERHFYTLDPAAIGRSLGAPDMAPMTLVALGAAVDGGPVPAQALPRPPNNHLQYAFTWFGLAAALAGVFLFWRFGERNRG